VVAHALTSGVVVINRGAPGSFVLVREVGSERVEIVSVGTLVVVHDVEADTNAALVSGVDKPGKTERATVSLVYGVHTDAVIAPSPITRERRDRHQFNDAHSKLGEMVELLDRRIEGALRRERAHV